MWNTCVLHTCGRSDCTEKVNKNWGYTVDSRAEKCCALSWLKISLASVGRWCKQAMPMWESFSLSQTPIRKVKRSYPWCELKNLSAPASTDSDYGKVVFAKWNPWEMSARGGGNFSTPGRRRRAPAATCNINFIPNHHQTVYWSEVYHNNAGIRSYSISFPTAGVVFLASEWNIALFSR